MGDRGQCSHSAFMENSLIGLMSFLSPPHRHDLLCPSLGGCMPLGSVKRPLSQATSGASAFPFTVVLTVWNVHL